MPGRDLRILSLDGGGVCGLSSLYILKQLMEVMTAEQRAGSGGGSKPPKPYEYFDMIGGTSTGGWVCFLFLHFYLTRVAFGSTYTYGRGMTMKRTLSL